MLSTAIEAPCYIYGDENEAPEIEGFVFLEKITDSGCSSNYLYRGGNGDLYVAKVLYDNCLLFSKEIEFLNFFKEDETVVDIAFEKHTIDNQKIIMTKYCRFGDLWTFLENMGEITPSLFYKIIIELVKAVLVLHENNVYHGDIKPNNFFVRDFYKETEDIHIVIADFGFAKDLDNPLTCLIPDGHTPGYAAPEVERYDSVSLSSDIFSLGKVFERIYYYVNDYIPIYISIMINRMIEENPEERPTIKDIVSELKEKQEQNKKKITTNSYNFM